MYLDLFNLIKNKDPSPISSTSSISFLTTSLSSCYFDNIQIGTCTRKSFFSYYNYDRTNDLNDLVKDLKNSLFETSKEWFLNELNSIKDITLFKDIPSEDSSVFLKDSCHGLIKNKEEYELILIKTYDGSKYTSNTIYGTSKLTPTPKLKHLIQAFRFLLIHQCNNINFINLCYIDTATSQDFKNIQFRISVFEDSGKLYPNIQVRLPNGQLTSYINKEITDVGIKNAEVHLYSCLTSNTIPNRDYIPVFTHEEIEQKYQKGLIYKTNYELYKKNKDSVILGDYECMYCPYNKGTCQKYD